MIRKIEKVGDGGAILFDEELRAITGLKLGDRVKLEILETGGLRLTPCRKRTTTGKRLRR